MPNLMLTTRCPNRCPWCFARARMDEYRLRGINEMGWTDFLALAGFLEASGCRHIALLGGEPLLHSRILDMLELLREKRIEASVGTTGVIPAALVDGIARLDFPGLDFGVNSTTFFDYGPRKRARADYFLRRIGHPTGISHTVTERDLRPGPPLFLLDRIAMISRYSLKRHLTLQIALPAEGNAGHVPFGRYGELPGLLRHWIDILRRNGISCFVEHHNIPRCAIPGDSAGGQDLQSCCGVFPLDIGPDLMVWPCFPLSGLGLGSPLARFRNFYEAQAHFRGQTEGMSPCVEEKCLGCPELAGGRCTGGCLGFEHARRQPVAPARPASLAALR